MALAQSTQELDRNVFKTFWLAVGFGLRASEIAVVTNGEFITQNGIVYLSSKSIAKNKKFPKIRCQLGAWEHLGSLIGVERKKANETVLVGNKTERTSDVFRRISKMFIDLGWETTHHLHEMRAWAGCQIAMAPGGKGLLDAQVFMRHAHYSTTDTFYGHHLKITLKEVAMPETVKLPSTPIEPAAPAAGFVPVIVPKDDSHDRGAKEGVHVEAVS